MKTKVMNLLCILDRTCHCPPLRWVRKFPRDPTNKRESWDSPINCNYKVIMKRTWQWFTHTQVEWLVYIQKSHAVTRIQRKGERTFRVETEDDENGFNLYSLSKRSGQYHPANNSPMEAFGAPFWVLTTLNTTFRRSLSTLKQNPPPNAAACVID